MNKLHLSLCFGNMELSTSDPILGSVVSLSFQVPVFFFF